MAVKFPCMAGTSPTLIHVSPASSEGWVPEVPAVPGGAVAQLWR